MSPITFDVVVAASSSKSAAPRRRVSSWVPYLLVAPSIIFLLILVVYPLAFSLVNSFQFWNLQMNAEPLMPVGLGNYRNALTTTPFLASLGNTFIIAILGTIIQFSLGFAIALLLQSGIRGMRATRAILLLPVTIAPIVAGIMFRYLYQRPGGLIDWGLETLGLPVPAEGILGSSATALAAVLFVDIWQWTPFFAIVLYAALLGVPDDYVEAARLDGAGRWNLIRHVLLPLVKSTAVIVIMIRFMQLFNMFDVVLVLTQGGPGTASRTLAYDLYRVGLVDFNIGLASAMTWMIVLMMNVIIAVYVFWAFRHWEW